MNWYSVSGREMKRFMIRRSFHQQNYDIAIVGGGIVGLATAKEIITRQPQKSIVILEKEDSLGNHQTGHNSGVIHAGIYYQPGSLKARLCLQGLKSLYKYCDENNIPYKKCGKLIVAVRNEEVMPLQTLYDRGKQNKVEGLSLVAGKDIKQIEPHCKGVVALHSANTGIVDYGVVTKSYGKVFQGHGGVIVNNFEVTGFKYSETSMKDGDYPVKISAKNQSEVACKHVITCGGLYSDRLAALTGCESSPKIVPFRGDYLVLKKEKSHLVKGNIYPVPNPQFPFLGVHFTPRMDGSVWLGPNAILAFKREGYNMADFSWRDALDTLSFRGFQSFLLKHWKFASKELYNALVLKKTIERLQQFIPELKLEDVERGPSGVRAQAMDPLGNLVDDFIFDTSPTGFGRRCLHVRNAPSPAATSSLAIAQMIGDKFEETILRT